MKYRYQTPLPMNWFVQRTGYLKFMLREFTSVFIVAYLISLVWWLSRLAAGPESYAAIIEGARHPLTVIFHVIVLIGAIYHSITWFNLTPKIMPMYIAEERVPDTWAAIIMGYVPWLAVSAILVWSVLRGGTE